MWSEFKHKRKKAPKKQRGPYSAAGEGADAFPRGSCPASRNGVAIPGGQALLSQTKQTENKESKQSHREDKVWVFYIKETIFNNFIWLRGT